MNKAELKEYVGRLIDALLAEGWQCAQPCSLEAAFVPAGQGYVNLSADTDLKYFRLVGMRPEVPAPEPLVLFGKEVHFVDSLPGDSFDPLFVMPPWEGSDASGE